MRAQLRFPNEDLERHRKNESLYQAAAICRRGHIVKFNLKPGELYPDDEKCATCGAVVLVGCVSCGLRIRGNYRVPLVLSASRSPRPSFCDGCGAAHPWATRVERIFELENLLDEEDIDEADRVYIHDRLRELRESEQLDDKRERQIWGQIRDRSGRFLVSGAVQRITETLVSAAIRSQLGI